MSGVVIFVPPRAGAIARVPPPGHTGGSTGAVAPRDATVYRERPERRERGGPARGGLHLFRRDRFPGDNGTPGTTPPPRDPFPVDGLPEQAPPAPPAASNARRQARERGRQLLLLLLLLLLLALQTTVGVGEDNRAGAREGCPGLPARDRAGTALQGTTPCEPLLPDPTRILPVIIAVQRRSANYY